MKRNSAFLIGLLLALLISGSVWAQGATPEATPPTTPEATEAQPATLSYGTPVTGTIDSVNFQQGWPLATASADRIMVHVERTSGNLIPDVNVLDSTGTVIAQAYGADKTFAAAEIADFTLPAAGKYTVQVTRDGADSGTTKGGYSLEVTPLGTGSDNPNNQTVIGEIKADTPTDGEITATHWLHLYTYTAQAGDALDIHVKRTGGTLQPVVYVVDANGQTLQTGYNSDSIAETNEFALPAPGKYTIEVSRSSDQTGDTLGTYELTVHLVGSGAGSPALQAAAGKVAYDQELTGTINGAQWYQDWQLTTDAGDTLTITMQRKDGDLEPEISLLGGSGQELTHGYSDNAGATATVDSYSLAGPGTYTVRATRKSGMTGDTSGAYTLTVALNGTGAGSPRLSASTGDVTLGQAATGQITNALWQNVWTFNSAKGGSINVTVQRTDGTLSPTVEIRDANGQSMNSANSSPSRDSATITSFQLPGPGKYQIVVSRDSGQSGATTGKYSLTVSTAK